MLVTSSTRMLITRLLNLNASYVRGEHYLLGPARTRRRILELGSGRKWIAKTSSTRDLNPCELSLMASYDAASNI
jgi:hypothetical protein